MPLPAPTQSRPPESYVDDPAHGRLDRVLGKRQARAPVNRHDHCQPRRYGLDTAGHSRRSDRRAIAARVAPVTSIRSAPAVRRQRERREQQRHVVAPRGVVDPEIEREPPEEGPSGLRRLGVRAPGRTRAGSRRRRAAARGGREPGRRRRSGPGSAGSAGRRRRAGRGVTWTPTAGRAALRVEDVGRDRRGRLIRRRWPRYPPRMGTLQITVGDLHFSARWERRGAADDRGDPADAADRVEADPLPLDAASRPGSRSATSGRASTTRTTPRTRRRASSRSTRAGSASARSSSRTAAARRPRRSASWPPTTSRRSCPTRAGRTGCARSAGAACGRARQDPIREVE